MPTNLSRVFALWCVLAGFVALPALADDETPAAESPVALDVFKSPTCGCCAAWIEHVEERGFEVNIHEPQNLNLVKQSYGIPNRFQSCHTAVTKDGYVFEGHVPANIMRRFLEEKPEDAIGLTVPGMPVGSPGMEVGDNFMPYQVLLLTKSGDLELYAEVRTREEQY